MPKANHTQASLSTYPFPIFFEEWGLDVQNITRAWDNKGDIIIGNDVWIGYEAVILSLSLINISATNIKLHTKLYICGCGGLGRRARFRF